MVRVLALILASDNTEEYRGFCEVWRKVMAKSPEVDYFFYKEAPDQKEKYVIDHATHTIWIGIGYGQYYQKTLNAFDAISSILDQYDYVIRPNLSSFIVWPRFLTVLEKLPRELLCAAVIGRHGSITFPSGANFVLSKDLVRRFIMERPPEVYLDDVTCGAALMKWDVPIHPLPRTDLTSETMYTAWENNTTHDGFHYRVKSHNRSRDVAIHHELFERFYSS